ncbi:anoctamin-10-like [Callorhinchus milii]|uniref:anoctamin-10-like n=1 Tax=Callorhinchus milii TaxID=7868 RepID=UPI001C3F764D|nr:anoctamin-10-like [Callorhinchus milii]
MTSAAPIGSLVVIEMSAEVGEETVGWLRSRIVAGKRSNGAELEAQIVPRSGGPKGTVLLVSASAERLLRGAEELGLMKEDKEGNFKPFKLADRRDFALDETYLISLAEGLYIIKRELDALKAVDEEHVPGEPGVKLYPGQPILAQLLLSKMAAQVFPLHDREELERLWESKRYLITQPLDPIRDYFGESVAMYFGFLGYFTWGVAFKTLLEIFLYVANLKERGGNALSAVYNIVWVTAFPKGWKRRSSAMAYKWGTLQHKAPGGLPDELRPGFVGKLGTNPVTGKTEPVFLDRQRYLRVLGASLPFTCFSLYITLLLMQTFLHLDGLAKAKHAKEKSGQSAVLSYTPLLGYCLVLELLNKMYLVLAQAFTELENHRSASSHDNHLLAKILTFYFVNNFGMHYFLAFYRRDFDLLSQTISAQLLVHQVFGQLLEGGLPYWMVVFKRNKIERSLPPSTKAGLHLIETEGALNPSKDALLKDYLELFLMFGYVNLFSSIAPLSAALCFLHNLTGIQVDGVRFKKVLQRPFPEPSSDIGMWQLAFEYLSSLAIVTNCALISTSPEFRSLFDLPDVQYFLMTVAMEHGLLGVQQVVHTAVPRVPSDIAVRLEKMERGCPGGGPCPPQRKLTTEETTTEYLDCLEACLTRALNQLNKNYQP